MRPINAVRITLRLPTTVMPLILRAGTIVMAMEENAALFPSPTPPLVTVKADMEALQHAQVACESGGGDMAQRETLRAKLSSDVQQLHLYVQSLAKANPEQAEALATGAAMTLRKPPTRWKPDLELRQRNSGSLRAIAKAIRGARAYDWQVSTNGGETWSSLTPTTQAHIDITGLTPGTVLFLRCRAITAKGALAWVGPISRMVT